MPTSFELAVDIVEVPGRPAPLRRAHTVPTDAGMHSKASSSSSDAVIREDSYSGIFAANGQPYDYPAPVYVRNTFVMLAPGRDPSLDEFFEERRIHSCPPSWGPTLGDCKELDDEVPLASSRTTACGSTPSSTPPLELSDCEDTAEMPFRGAASASSRFAAGLLPSSSPFRKKLSNYNENLDAGAAYDATDRLAPLPLQPGLQSALPPQSPEFEPAVYHSGFTDERYRAAFAGCDPSYETGYDNRCDSGYHNGYNPGTACTNGAFPPSFDGYQLHSSNNPGQRMRPDAPDFVMPSESRPQGNQHVVLQLSAAIQAGPPPPPGVPAPMPSALSPPPDAPMVSPDGDIVAPTIGSVSHGYGRCKPCAFFHTKGCGNGYDCPFCHLCEPGEKKKRRKEKLEVRRTMRDLRQVLPFGNFGSMGYAGRTQIGI